jgi:hypothetical protein
MKFESSGLGGQKSNFKFASTGLSQDSPIPGLTSSSFKIHHSSLTLGVTAAHPFWSVDREGFVPAGELRQYERVVAMDGREFRLTSITPRDGPETVYNFEVANEHVYYVGEDGLLVHNNYFRRIYYGAKNLASRIGRWFSDSRSWRTIKKGRGGTPPGMSFEHIISRNGWFAKKLKIPEQFLNGKFNSGLLLPARWNNGFLAATGWRGFRNRGLFVSVQSHRSGFLATVVGTVGTEHMMVAVIGSQLMVCPFG